MVYVGSIVRNRPKKRPSMTGTRRALFNAHGGICAYCRRKTEMPSLLPGKHHDLIATVEHIVPLCRGGNMRGDNITLACAACNSMKADMTPHQWAEFMMANPQWWQRSKLRRVRSTAPVRPPLALPLAKLAPKSHIRSMTAEENWRRIKVYMANQPPKEAPLVCPVMAAIAKFFVDQKYGVWKPRQPAAVQNI